MASAFIVHGRDLAARDEVAKLLRSLSLEVASFEDVAASMPQPCFVADVVFRGIQSASVVVVLFTPDELAIHYEPKTGANLGEARWQARPNVLFEAGVALGAKGGATVLVSLGADVSLFSDVDGMHILRLDRSGSKRQFLERLRTVEPSIVDPGASWESEADSGDFDSCLRRRWTPFDETAALAQALQAQIVGGSRSVLEHVRSTLRRNKGETWGSKTPADFCAAMERLYDTATVNDVYWWLFVHGFFRAQDIGHFYDGTGNTWRQGVPYAAFTERGLKLIERMRCGAA